MIAIGQGAVERHKFHPAGDARQQADQLRRDRQHHLCAHLGDRRRIAGELHHVAEALFAMEQDAFSGQRLAPPRLPRQIALLMADSGGMQAPFMLAPAFLIETGAQQRRAQIAAYVGMVGLQPGRGAEPADRLGQAAGFLQQGGQIVDGRRQVGVEGEGAPEASLRFGRRIQVAQHGAEIAPALRRLGHRSHGPLEQAAIGQQQAEMIEHLRLRRQQDQQPAIEVGGLVAPAGGVGGDGGGEQGLRGGIGHS